jgi:hypothetical protein
MSPNKGDRSRAPACRRASTVGGEQLVVFMHMGLAPGVLEIASAVVGQEHVHRRFCDLLLLGRREWRLAQGDLRPEREALDEPLQLHRGEDGILCL